MYKTKNKTAEEIYDQLVSEGHYEEANIDKSEMNKMLLMNEEDYEFVKRIKNLDKPNYRIVFQVHYDLLQELCALLMRFKKQKISNHQGLFAFIILNFPELEFEWEFFERVRLMRNYNKYERIDIPKDKWKEVEVKIDFYINTLINEIKKMIVHI